MLTALTSKGCCFLKAVRRIWGFHLDFSRVTLTKINGAVKPNERGKEQ